MPSSRQELLLAYRWPIALVGSSLILGVSCSGAGANGGATAEPTDPDRD